jgi:hypothetical protein
MMRQPSRFGPIFRRKLLSSEPANALVQGALAVTRMPRPASQSMMER